MSYARGQHTASWIDANYPYQVEIEFPLGGPPIGLEIEARARFHGHEFTSRGAKGLKRRYCFKTPEAAAAIHALIGGELLEVRRSRR